MFVDVVERAQDIADAARARAQAGGPTIVAVDGAGGSGKSTVAARAAEMLDGAPLVHGDDFYRHLIVFVDTPREVCLRRVRARWQDSDEWIARWRAAEDFYLRTTRPQTRLQLLVRGYGD